MIVLMDLNGSAPICVSAVRKDPRGLRLEDLVTYFRIHNMVRVRSLQPASPPDRHQPLPPRLSYHHGNNDITVGWGRCQEACTPLMRLEAETKEKEMHACRQWGKEINVSSDAAVSLSQFDLNSALNCLEGGKFSLQTDFTLNKLTKTIQ